MKCLNVTQESVKILGNRGNHLSNCSHSNFLLDTSPKARKTKAKMNYWDFIKIKSFHKANSQQNSQTTYKIGEDICKFLIR